MALTVGVVGSGPAVNAVEAALEDADADHRPIDASETSAVDLPIVVGVAGNDAFQRANRKTEGPWIAVELGGIGGLGLPDVDGAMSVFGPDAGCFECLAARVRSNLTDNPDDRPTMAPADARLLGAHAGRTAVAFAAEETDLLGTVTELPYARRELHPVPGCDCDAEPDHQPESSFEDPSLDEVAAGMERAVDPRIGLLREIGEAESFPSPYYLATLCDTTIFSDAQAGEQSAGVAADWDTAFVKAIGEGLERYCAGVYRSASFRTDPASAVTDAVPPEAFVRPDEGYAPSDPEERIPWIRGEELHEGRPVYLPVEFVQFPPPTERHRPAITTGLGLGSSGVEALLSGLYEVVERDATMIAWYSTYDPMGLTSGDAGLAELEKRARAEDLTLTTALVTQDIDIPVVAAAVHRESEWPQFAAGSAASLDPDRAARSAAAEALQNWMELRGMGPDRASDQEGWIGRYADRPGAALDFLQSETAIAATDLRPDSSPTGPAELAAVLDRLSDASLAAFASRITTRDVARLGFEAVRVLVPEAQPLFVEGRYFGERARTVPRSLGYRPRLDREPHPFP